VDCAPSHSPDIHTHPHCLYTAPTHTHTHAHTFSIWISGPRTTHHILYICGQHDTLHMVAQHTSSRYVPTPRHITRVHTHSTPGAEKPHLPVLHERAARAAIGQLYTTCDRHWVTPPAPHCRGPYTTCHSPAGGSCSLYTESCPADTTSANMTPSQPSTPLHPPSIIPEPAPMHRRGPSPPTSVYSTPLRCHLAVNLAGDRTGLRPLSQDRGTPELRRMSPGSWPSPA
jgi:hypothetical protein